jgi:DNA-binding response OmpR family regulator
LLGADDFLSKPFSLNELQARIDRALSRGHGSATDGADRTGPAHQVGRLRVDPSRCLATADGEPLPLTPTEFQLLVALASRPGAVLARDELAARVWEGVDAGVLRSLQVHMRRLRSKLRAAAPQLRLVSRRGFGYQLVDDAMPAP